MSSDLHSPDSSDISNSVQSMLDVPLEHHTSGSLRRLQSCVHPLNALEANLMLGVTLDDGATHSGFNEQEMEKHYDPHYPIDSTGVRIGKGLFATVLAAATAAIPVLGTFYSGDLHDQAQQVAAADYSGQNTAQNVESEQSYISRLPVSRSRESSPSNMPEERLVLPQSVPETVEATVAYADGKGGYHHDYEVASDPGWHPTRGSAPSSGSSKAKAKRVRGGASWHPTRGHSSASSATPASAASPAATSSRVSSWHPTRGYSRAPARSRGGHWNPITYVKKAGRWIKGDAGKWTRFTDHDTRTEPKENIQRIGRLPSYAWHNAQRIFSTKLRGVDGAIRTRDDGSVINKRVLQYGTETVAGGFNLLLTPLHFARDVVYTPYNFLRDKTTRNVAGTPAPPGGVAPKPSLGEKAYKLGSVVLNTVYRCLGPAVSDVTRTTWLEATGEHIGASANMGFEQNDINDDRNVTLGEVVKSAPVARQFFVTDSTDLEGNERPRDSRMHQWTETLLLAFKLYWMKFRSKDKERGPVVDEEEPGDHGRDGGNAWTPGGGDTGEPIDR
jgi:hypothetical protein